MHSTMLPRPCSGPLPPARSLLSVSLLLSLRRLLICCFLVNNPCRRLSHSSRSLCSNFQLCGHLPTLPSALRTPVALAALRMQQSVIDTQACKQ